MISPQALQELLNHICRAAARKAALRIPEYDLATVERYLDLMAQENLSGWEHGEIIATLEARTTAGCRDRDDPSQAQAIQQCFQDAVWEITVGSPVKQPAPEPHTQGELPR